MNENVERFLAQQRKAPKALQTSKQRVSGSLKPGKAAPVRPRKAFKEASAAAVAPPPPSAADPFPAAATTPWFAVPFSSRGPPQQPPAAAARGVKAAAATGKTGKKLQRRGKNSTKAATKAAAAAAFPSYVALRRSMGVPRFRAKSAAPQRRTAGGGPRKPFKPSTAAAKGKSSEGIAKPRRAADATSAAPRRVAEATGRSRSVPAGRYHSRSSHNERTETSMPVPTTAAAATAVPMPMSPPVPVVSLDLLDSLTSPSSVASHVNSFFASNSGRGEKAEGQRKGQGEGATTAVKDPTGGGTAMEGAEFRSWVQRTLSHQRQRSPLRSTAKPLPPPPLPAAAATARRDSNATASVSTAMTAAPLSPSSPLQPLSPQGASGNAVPLREGSNADLWDLQAAWTAQAQAMDEVALIEEVEAVSSAAVQRLKASLSLSRKRPHSAAKQ